MAKSFENLFESPTPPPSFENLFARVPLLVPLFGSKRIVLACADLKKDRPF